MSTQSLRMAQLQLLQKSSANEGVTEYRKADGTVRHKCFLSYHAEDAEEVLAFVNSFETVFIPKCLGVDEDDPWLDSKNTDYIMDTVRDKYLADSTVTIVLVGRCTWARKYVDWEVYSSLRRDKVNRLNGLLAIQLPSAASGGGPLPARVNDNVIRDPNSNDIGYARYNAYPLYTSSLQSWIEDAFNARTSRPHLINNSRDRRTNNSAC